MTSLPSLIWIGVYALQGVLDEKHNRPIYAILAIGSIMSIAARQCPLSSHLASIISTAVWIKTRSGLEAFRNPFRIHESGTDPLIQSQTPV